MDRSRFPRAIGGFSLIEVMVTLLTSLIVIGSVFELFGVAQDVRRREQEVAEMMANTRAALQSIDRDLVEAGYRTPPAVAILWNHGGGLQPDEITILRTEAFVPLASPATEASSATIDASSTLFLESLSLDPMPSDPSRAYPDETFLLAIETRDCNGDGVVGIYPFETTQPSRCAPAGPRAADDPDCATLMVNHNPGADSDWNVPGGFNRAVRADCALIGSFRVIQYRIHPPPPTPHPALERRDLSAGGGWVPVAGNIENLQVQYAVGSQLSFVDVPGRAPDAENPETWITRVHVSVTGRTNSANLPGGSRGVFSEADTHVRQTFSSTTALRNQIP